MELFVYGTECHLMFRNETEDFVATAELPAVECDADGTVPILSKMGIDTDIIASHCLSAKPVLAMADGPRSGITYCFPANTNGTSLLHGTECHLMFRNETDAFSIIMDFPAVECRVDRLWMENSACAGVYSVMAH